MECGPPPGLALRSAMISSMVVPGFTLSCACIMVSIETVSPEFTLSLGGSFGSSQPHCTVSRVAASVWCLPPFCCARTVPLVARSEEHTSELQSQFHLVCRLLLEKKKIKSERLAVLQHIRELSYIVYALRQS